MIQDIAIESFIPTEEDGKGFVEIVQAGSVVLRAICKLNCQETSNRSLQNRTFYKVYSHFID